MNKTEIENMMRAMYNAESAAPSTVGTLSSISSSLPNSLSNPFRQTYPTSSTVADDISTDLWRLRAIAMRMRIPEGNRLPFQHVSTAWTGEKVFVFVVENDKPAVLEDESALFPSDTLITQLRLIQK